jgi:ankyrin repeat protein
MNLMEAAGVGHLDLVQTYFDDEGRLTKGATNEDVESGFLYACGYGRLETARFLLDRGVNPGVVDKDSRQTPLHWTSFGPHVEVAALLVERGAPIDARDTRFQATPVDWAVHAWTQFTDPNDRYRAYQLIALLTRSGAVFDRNRFGSDVAARINADPQMLAALRGEDPSRGD